MFLNILEEKLNLALIKIWYVDFGRGFVVTEWKLAVESAMSARAFTLR